MKRLVVQMALLTVLLAGCNTIRGIGQDLQKLGDAISGAAKK